DQISGEGAWMNFRIFVRPPPGGSTHSHPRGWRRRLTPALAAALCRSRYTPSRRRAFNYARKEHKLVTLPRGGGFYRDEIEIKESHSKHRKLDSQTDHRSSILPRHRRRLRICF